MKEKTIGLSLLAEVLVTFLPSCGNRSSDTREERTISPGAAGNQVKSVGTPAREGGTEGSVSSTADAADGSADRANDESCASDGQSCVDANITRCTDDRDCSWPRPNCVDGSCQLPMSCRGLDETCGPAQSSSCCASNLVPEYDGNPPECIAPAVNGSAGGCIDRVSAIGAFRLDNYEVTVGRFRKFVAEYPKSLPAPFSGKNSTDPSDTGWRDAWNAMLPPSAPELAAALACDRGLATWTDSPGDNENRPINCVTWPLADAFCIWDGGRLPSTVEWYYAESGGNENRTYPWGNAQVGDDLTSHGYGSFKWYCSQGCCDNGLECCVGDGQPGCALTDFLRVGASSPKSDGRWGQSELVGNVEEWLSDRLFDDYTTCAACADGSAVKPCSCSAQNGLVLAYVAGSSYRRVPIPHRVIPLLRDNIDAESGGGIRCARSP